MKRIVYILIFSQIFLTAQSENLLLLDHWTKDSLPFCYDGESIFNEVWGVNINGSDYGILGSTAGAHFFKIENDQLFEVAFVEGKYVGRQAVHRDYHDYNGYLYAVCDENFSSLQIMDLHYLPDSVPVLYDSDSLIIRAHNLFIDTSTAKLYACAVATNSGFNAMDVYDISSPLEPILLYSYNDVGHVHDAYVYNDTAFLNCGSEGLKVIKSSSNNIAIQLGELNVYLDKDYNHSGWLNESKTTYIMCDEAPGKDVKVVDVSDLNDIKVSSFFNSSMGDDENSIPHNVIVRNDIAYLSYYHDGLQIFDISDPIQPKKLAYYDTYIGSPNVSWAGSWGVYPFRNGDRIIASDRANGLFLLGFNPPPSVVENSFSIFPNPVEDYLYFYREHFAEADYNLVIHDLIGKKIETFHVVNDYFKIENLSRLKTGIYFLTYSSNLDSTVLTLKFFIL